MEESKSTIDAALGGWSQLSQNMQSFASEIAQMSKQSYEHATETMEKLRGAKTPEELMSIQSGFVKESFESFTQRTRKLSEMMSSLPLEMAKSYQDAVLKAADVAMKATKSASQSVADAASKAADMSKS